jgi:ribonuclease P protein component
VARFAFPRQARLSGEAEFRRVYRGGRRLKSFPLRVHALRRPEGQSRLGLAIGRKVGRPAVCNRWKRAVREAFRLNRHRLRAPYDLVVSVSWEAEPGQVGAVGEAFERVIADLNAAEAAGERGDGAA